MPFRLLGLAGHPDRASDLCGQAFARYAASGIEITLVCAQGRGWKSGEERSQARALGVRDLVLLGYEADEVSAGALEAVFTDLMTGIRPHVVVADETPPAVKDAAVAAFARARRGIGSGALPAKLYYRAAAADPAIAVTTAVPVSDGVSIARVALTRHSRGATPRAAALELFVRAWPKPWVTGVLERDLFAGLLVDQPRLDEERERRAS